MNLPIPLCFASFAVEGSTWIGIGIALVALLMCGFATARYRPRQIQLVATGGLLTTASQFIPLLHIFCGSVAFMICEAIGLASNPDDTLATLHGPLGGFVATLLTALPVIAFAWAAGFIVSSFQSWHSNGKKS